MATAMSGMNQPGQTPMAPPPISVVAYHIAVNGQATGPYNMNVLQQMVAAGQFAADSLVWKNGMAAWEIATNIDELKQVFNVMPPIPSVPLVE